MKLYTKCIDCKSDLMIKSWVSTRVDLKMKLGDKMEITCKNCNRTNKYSIDDLKARESKIAALIGLVVLVIGTPFILILLWDYIWQTGLYGAFGLILIIGIPGSVFMIINKNEQSRVSSFNRS